MLSFSSSGNWRTQYVSHDKQEKMIILTLVKYLLAEINLKLVNNESFLTANWMV